MPALKSPFRATIADVARRAGVSTATVSRVINQTAPVAPETVLQVQTAITELDYRPHAAAQVLASRKTTTLGLLVPEISGDYFVPLLRGIEAGARESGFGLLVYSTFDLSPAQAGPPQPLGEHNADGLVVFTNSLPAAELIRLHNIGFPVVLLHRSPPEQTNIPCVTVENKSGARQLVDHLIEKHGYRRIAFLAGPAGNEDSDWRELGYRQSLASHGLPFDPALVAIGGFEKGMAEDAVDGWLEAGLEIEAIFAADDESAVGVMTALNRAGKRIPEDVALVGFDDTYISRYLTPPLTTVRAPIEQAGREAVRLLLDLIDGKQIEPLVLLPTELVIRRSCGCG